MPLIKSNREIKIETKKCQLRITTNNLIRKKVINIRNSN